MKKSLWILCALLALNSGFAGAEGMKFKLYCQWDGAGTQPVGGPQFQVVKTSQKNSKGKWVTSYSLEVTPMNPTAKSAEFKFTSAGSGDEDYTEYNLEAGSNTGIQGAAIQNAFQWASLIDTGGSVAWDCRKPR